MALDDDNGCVQLIFWLNKQTRRCNNINTKSPCASVYFDLFITTNQDQDFGFIYVREATAQRLLPRRKKRTGKIGRECRGERKR